MNLPETKSNASCPPTGERWPHCIRQDQLLRNTSVPLLSTHGHKPKGIERGGWRKVERALGVEVGRVGGGAEAVNQREREQMGYSEQ